MDLDKGAGIHQDSSDFSLDQLILIGAPIMGFSIFAAFLIGYNISGGHFNPGSVVASVYLGNMKVDKAFRYIIAQLIGGFLACIPVEL